MIGAQSKGFFNLTDEKAMAFAIARIAAAIILIVALERLPYGYYTLLRFLVCGVTAYGAYLSVGELNKTGWAWAFGVLAVLFNPFVPIHLNRGAWAVIDIAVALFLLVSLAFVKTSNNQE